MRSSDGSSGAGYSRADRLLHQVALGFAPVLEMSFDIERGRYGKAADALDCPAPVFVCGLARAGTTVLMRALHGSGAFASLSYRDLPFPLAPNSWARMTSGAKREIAARERGHGDGLTHDLDSPEAIEEVFWRAQEGARYLKRDGLAPVPPAPAAIAAFRTYVRLVLLRYGKPRYLSKDNNNILRLPALVEAFPDAVLVHPFRDPLQQAASLLNQHRRACELQAGDAFRRKFMAWLGHHEFGADQRPFLVEGYPAGDRERINYWLTAWISVHRFLLAQPEPVRARQAFLDYDRLSAEGAAAGPKLAAIARINAESLDLAGLRPPAPRLVEDANPALVETARQVHAQLRERRQTLS